jgi:alpha-glucosidase (family GH31 glycosyl hydrolase)
MYSYIVEGHGGGNVLQRPVDGKYHYLFGEYLLIAPIYEDSQTRIVDLPEGEWRYLFNDHELIEGSSTIERAFPLDEYPVYVREGAIIPLKVTRPYTGFGDSTSAGYLTILLYPGKDSSFLYYQPDGKRLTTISVRKEKDNLEISLAGDKIPHLLRIYRESEPQEVILDGGVLEKGKSWQFVSDDNRLIMKTDAYGQGNYVIR